MIRRKKKDKVNLMKKFKRIADRRNRIRLHPSSHYGFLCQGTIVLPNLIYRVKGKSFRNYLYSDRIKTSKTDRLQGIQRLESQPDFLFGNFTGQYIKKKDRISRKRYKYLLSWYQGLLYIRSSKDLIQRLKKMNYFLYFRMTPDRVLVPARKPDIPYKLIRTIIHYGLKFKSRVITLWGNSLENCLKRPILEISMLSSIFSIKLLGIKSTNHLDRILLKKKANKPTFTVKFNRAICDYRIDTQESILPGGIYL